MRGFLSYTKPKGYRKFKGAANQRPEIAMAYSFFNTRTPGYHVEVDRVKAKRLGVAVSNVYGTMSSYMGSRYINDFTRYGRNFRHPFCSCLAVKAQLLTLFFSVYHQRRTRAGTVKDKSAGFNPGVYHRTLKGKCQDIHRIVLFT